MLHQPVVEQSLTGNDDAQPVDKDSAGALGLIVGIDLLEILVEQVGETLYVARRSSEFDEPLVTSFGSARSVDGRCRIVQDGIAGLLARAGNSLVGIVDHQFFAECVDVVLGASGNGDGQRRGALDAHGVAGGDSATDRCTT